MTRAGAPTATEYDGMSCVTTAPVPITEPWPMVTPATTETRAPIQTSSSTVMGAQARPWSWIG